MEDIEAVAGEIWDDVWVSLSQELIKREYPEVVIDIIRTTCRPVFIQAYKRGSDDTVEALKLAGRLK